VAFSLETMNKRDFVRRAQVSARSFEDRDGMSGNRLLLSVAAIALLLACLWSQAEAAANPGEEQDCDVTADYFLGAENYPETIRLHREVLRKHPENALAHYHLGFAEGMAGDRTQELNEYRRAAGLGLSSWDLFLNTGLALFENGSLEAATDALRLAVRLGPNRPESHFNLGLIYERRDMLAEAEQEMLASLRLEPEQLDARNMLGVIYARQGDKARAAAQWRHVLRNAPDHGPARANLMILDNKQPIPAREKEEARSCLQKPTGSNEDR
jgi:Flp pilus assembly protein TadD